MEPGFEKATDQNLPNIDDAMVIEYFRTNPDFHDPELRNVKTTKATREVYGDNAVGYVQLSRVDRCCTVKGKITPEHKVHKAAYQVKVVINENDDIIEECKCLSCPASEGSCKHGIAFLLWLHRRASQPAVTETECYWKASKLSKVGSSVKYVTLKDLASKPVPVLPNVGTGILEQVLNDGRKRKSSGNIFLETFPADPVSQICMHKMYIKFREENNNDPEKFMAFISEQMTSTVCRIVEIKTCEQYKSNCWYRARYGRITASNVYQASRCKTHGSLVASVLGSCRPIITEAIQRGRTLEKKVLKEIKDAYELKQLQENCGLFLNGKYPIFGASPDALTPTHVVEIKCPFKEDRVTEYITEDGQPTRKPYAQIQLQMLLTGRKHGYYCVANPDFEKSKSFQVSEIDFDEDFITKVTEEAEMFWKKYIFPKL